MKIGWLVYEGFYNGNNDFVVQGVEFFKVKPENYDRRLVQIVYAEIIK